MSRFHFWLNSNLYAFMQNMGLLTETLHSPCNYADIHVKVVLNQ